jgi:hypothetical protein
MHEIKFIRHNTTIASAYTPHNAILLSPYISSKALNGSAAPLIPSRHAPSAWQAYSTSQAFPASVECFSIESQLGDTT